MRKLLVDGLAALISLTVLGSTSTARVIAFRIAPLPERVASCDCIVVAKVTAIEKKNVLARSYPGTKDKVEYQVAVVKIDEALVGAKGLTHIKIGFLPPQGPVGGPGGIRPGIRFQQVVLTEGQEGCFFLTPHFEENFYTVPGFYQVLDKKAADFDKQVAQIKRCAKLLSDPKAGLKSKEAEDRALTAGLLVHRYRRITGPIVGTVKQESIDAEESKLILQGLADGDWSKGYSATDLTPQMSFGILGLTDKDGWRPGPFKNYQVEFPAAAKNWLKENAGTYRIQRYVVEKKEKE